MELLDVFPSDMEKNQIKLSAYILKLGPLLIVIASLCVGAYLRMNNIRGYMTYLGDEGRDVMVVKRMIVDHKFTLLGPTASVGGFFMGPIYYYFMAPFLWAWQLDPVGPAVMVAIFGIATIYLVYTLGKSLFDSWTGAIAASLYSISPFIIAYSRSSWNPNIVPFFSTLFILFLWKYYKTGKYIYLGLAGVTGGVGLQLHYVFIFLIPIIVLWCYVVEKFKNLLHRTCVVVVGLVIGNSLFLAFELRHSFPNTKSIIQFIFTGKDTGVNFIHMWTTAIDVIYRLFGRLLLRLPDFGVFETWSHEAQFYMRLLIWVFATLATLHIFLPLIGKTKKTVHDKTESYSQILLLLWLIVSLIAFGFYKKQIYDYYFGIIYPIPFILTAWLLRRMFLHSALRVIALCILISLLWWNWEGRPFKFVPNNQLDQAIRIASEAIKLSNNKPFNFALLAANNSDHAYRYFFEIWGNAPVTIENNVIDPERKTVTDQLIIICELPECKPLGHPLWEIAGFGQAKIEEELDVPFVKLMKLTHYKESES